ncbi:MAG: aromatic amino acid hydroxylase [Bdellovibrionales bacterium]|nr:aromatic amino acid hydroxylase [Bdellovibrionales bacterium]
MMTSVATKRLPAHLKKYVVKQNYSRYTPEDQAVWRFLLRQLKNVLSTHAHPCYSEGLEKTGISINSIPKIEEVDAKLSEFGWGAVPVSGFIPPAAFMEFQSLGVLPIASDMRTLDHLLYTPAPDIVHEAAGHAPILVDPEFAAYLKRYAQVASKAIVSKEDLAQYEAIRELSDVKENPTSTPEDIKKCEKKLEAVNQSLRFVSEAGLLSRMNWWTAEYGLIGDLKKPLIFGAGLLSSLGEARDCLKDAVKKIPLTVDCIEYSYDITEPQPQLFVTPDFENLSLVLEELANRLSFRQGGVLGMQRALEARSVVSVELDSGLQISGILGEFIESSDDGFDFFKMTGPSQLSLNGNQLKGHGVNYHAQGYSSPLGRIRGLQKSLHECSEDEIHRLGLIEGENTQIEFTSGFKVSGKLLKFLWKDNSSQVLLLSFENCKVTRGDKVYFEPDWGVFDLAAGSTVRSVFGGPADVQSYPELVDFVAARVPAKIFSPEQKKDHEMYLKIKHIRSLPQQEQPLAVQNLAQEFLKEFYNNDSHWLLGLEIFELLQKLPDQNATNTFKKELALLAPQGQSQLCLQDGLTLAESTPLQ